MSERPCRKCLECEGNHHWLESGVPDEDEVCPHELTNEERQAAEEGDYCLRCIQEAPDYVCKHCEAKADLCNHCDGEALYCVSCGGGGVVQRPAAVA